MNFVIPMAGRGQRFFDAGYTLPKLLIEAHGKTLLQWSVDSLPLQKCTRLVFVGLQEHEARYGLRAEIERLYSGVAPLSFEFLRGVTGGQAETVLRARAHLDETAPLVIFNIDTAFSSASLATALDDPSSDGVLGAFPSCEPRFSYAAVDATGKVARVVEKEVISSHALTGLYHFRRTADFLAVADEAVRRNLRVKNEFFVAPLYSDLIAQGRTFTLNACEAHQILGTPDELKDFLALSPTTVADRFPVSYKVKIPSREGSSFQSSSSPNF